MTFEFRAWLAPAAELYSELARIRSACPFDTAAYATACRRIGRDPCVLAIHTDGKLVEGCVGLIDRGRLMRRLEIVSAPELTQPDMFWQGVRQFCRREGLWQFDIESFGSTSVQLPRWDTEISRRTRAEHVLDLAVDEPWRAVSSNHRRNVARARKAGCVLARASGAEAVATHLDLMRSSLQRRLGRGEAVVLPARSQFPLALLDSGAGEIYQIRYGDRVLSSLLVLRSAKGAYYHSAGTSSEGMQIGASSFLIVELAHTLSREGVAVFNLGGTGDDEVGLRRFKTGFGTRDLRLSAASFTISHAWVRRLRNALHSFRENPRALLSRFVYLEHDVVSAVRPGCIADTVDANCERSLNLRALDDVKLSASAGVAEWRDQAVRRTDKRSPLAPPPRDLGG